MTITFISNIKNNDSKNRIEFTAPVQISQMNEYEVFEFIEPSQNVANRIEVSEKNVNIFAGPSTINLELKELIRNEYTTINGNIFFDSFMDQLKIKENKIEFHYKLLQNNNAFGEFKIELNIKK